MSLRRSIYTYVEGAPRGWGRSELLIWDRQAGRRVTPEDLFDPVNAQAALNAFWFAAAQDLAAQKAERGFHDLSSARLASTEAWPRDLVLLPSTEPGLAGGFAHSGHYGTTVEGEYTVIVPASDLRFALRPEYQALFGGSPRPIEGFERIMCFSPALAGCPE